LASGLRGIVAGAGYGKAAARVNRRWFAPSICCHQNAIMRKLFLVLAVILAGSFFAVSESQAGIFVSVGVPGPVYYGPGYYPSYWYGAGYYAPGYYWGPNGYVYYRHPYWRHRYWRHGRWYWY
jgi:hypothetical protein